MKIVKIPFSLGSLGKNDGCKDGPRVIVEILKEFYLNEDGKIFDFKIEDFVIKTDNVDEFYSKLEKVEGDLFLGGDHSVTYSLFKGLNSKSKCLVLFDAHPDTEEGTKSVDHECFLRKLVEEKEIRDNVIIIGVRNFSSKEFKFLKENHIRYIPMKNVFEVGVMEICDDVMEFCREFNDVYLSLDIDVVDPAFAPGTGYCEPGGMSSRELIYFIQRLKLLKNLRRVDIVEVNPSKDINEMTSKLAAKVIVELA